MKNAVSNPRRGRFPVTAAGSAKAGATESNVFSSLKEALRERLAVIGDEQSRGDAEKHIARLRAVSQKIDRLEAALPQPVDPRLAHYLQRRSYDKALELLEGAGGTPAVSPDV
jgi:hypothetical protein